MKPKRHWSLLITRFSKKGILTWEKYNVVKEAITPPIARKIDTVNKTDKSQASDKTVDTSSSNKSEKGKSLDKSKSTQITDTEDTFEKVNNKGLFQELVYLKKTYQNRKTLRNRH